MRSSKKHKFTTKKIIVIFGSVVSLLITIFVFISYQNSQQQRLKREDLERFGTELDLLANKIEASEVAGSINRFKYCHEQSRKFESGPISCVQKLEVRGEQISDKQMLSDFSTLAEVMSEQSVFSFVSKDGLLAYNKNERIFKRFDPSFSPADTKCYVVFDGQNSNFPSEDIKSTYDVRVECSSNNLDGYFYPEL